MNWTMTQLNTADVSEVEQAFLGCCGSTWWAKQMATNRPFENGAHIEQIAALTFGQMHDSDWLEAFAAHPKLGDLDSLRMKFVGNQSWSAGEQAGVNKADVKLLSKLAEANKLYEARFGYIFILCATGLSARQMLDVLQRRLQNEPVVEMPIAIAEQKKITYLRLKKLLSES